MDIQTIEQDPLNDLLPIMDFSDATPEFPIDFIPNSDNKIYMNEEEQYASDYIRVKMNQHIESAEDLINRRKEFLIRVLDILENKNLSYVPKMTKELDIANYKIVYDARGIGAVPIKKEEFGWVCGMYIDTNSFGVTKG